MGTLAVIRGDFSLKNNTVVPVHLKNSHLVGLTLGFEHSAFALIIEKEKEAVWSLQTGYFQPFMDHALVKQ